MVALSSLPPFVGGRSERGGSVPATICIPACPPPASLPAPPPSLPVGLPLNLLPPSLTVGLPANLRPLASLSAYLPACLHACPYPPHTLIAQNTIEENRIHGLARNAQGPPTGSPGTPRDPPWIPQGHPKDAQGPPRDSPRRTKVDAPFTMWSCAEARKGASSQGA